MIRLWLYQLVCPHEWGEIERHYRILPDGMGTVWTKDFCPNCSKTREKWEPYP